MRWTDPLDEILGSRAKVRALRELCRLDRPVSGRELGKRTGMSHAGVLRALEELYEQGVVRLSPAGSSVGYAINDEHVLVSRGIRPLLAAEGSLDMSLDEFVRACVPDCVSIACFGSVARREDAPGGDIDVLIVLPDGSDTTEAFDAIAGGPSSRFGKRIEPVVWTISELRRNAKRKTPLAGRILDDHRLLSGEPLRTLLSRAGVGVRREAG